MKSLRFMPAPVYLCFCITALLFCPWLSMLARCNYGRIFTTPAGNFRNSFFENRLEAEFRVGGSYAARLSRSLSYSGPGLGRRHAPGNGGMRVEKPFHPRGRGTLGQILVGQLVHGGDKRLHRRDGSESIAVGLALVETRVGIAAAAAPGTDSMVATSISNGRLAKSDRVSNMCMRSTA